MRYDLVSAAAFMPACQPASPSASFSSRPSTYSNPVSDNNYSGSTTGERRSQTKAKEQIKSEILGCSGPGSIWEILPVGRGAFITAISFLQRGR